MSYPLALTHYISQTLCIPQMSGVLRVKKMHTFADTCIFSPKINIKVMGDISKQRSVDNKRIPQSTEMSLSFLLPKSVMYKVYKITTKDLNTLLNILIREIQIMLIKIKT